jgi:hypothetical protein
MAEWARAYSGPRARVRVRVRGRVGLYEPLAPACLPWQKGRGRGKALGPLRGSHRRAPFAGFHWLSTGSPRPYVEMSSGWKRKTKDVKTTTFSKVVVDLASRHQDKIE